MYISWHLLDLLDPDGGQPNICRLPPLPPKLHLQQSQPPHLDSLPTFPLQRGGRGSVNVGTN